MVYRYTLEREPNHDTLWTWSQTRIYVNRDLEHCAAFEVNRKFEFSWKLADLPMKCEAISFGF